MFIFQLKCCGINGFSDFANSTFQKRNPKFLAPDACCETGDDGAANRTVCYNKGCSPKLYEYYDEYTGLLVAVSAPLAICELILIPCTIGFMYRIKIGEYPK